MRKKSCGNCESWIKFRGRSGKGLCAYMDIGWVASDTIPQADNCWSALKFIRKTKYKEDLTTSYLGEL